MSSNKEKYRELCNTEPSIPIFSQAWWLDAVVSGGRWDVVLVEENNSILAAMPYVTYKRYGFIFLNQPPLTQTLGPWIKTNNLKASATLSQEKKILKDLIKGLPNFDYYAQNWSWKITNWLPFYWANFKQTTRYTYILDNLSDDKLLWQNLSGNIRTDIRKAKDKFNIRVRDDLPLDSFLRLNDMTFERQGLRTPYSENFVKLLDSACLKNNARKIFIAQDDQGKLHAGVYIVYDRNTCYYLMGGGNPTLRNSGATSLCLWEAIRFAATVSQSFDFEGSMMEHLERFFRSFGGKQTPYFAIHKTRSPILGFLKMLRDFV